MRFVKTYESFVNSDISDISELKKYAIWNWSNYKDKKDNGYDIIKIEEIVNNIVVWCREIYTYDKEKGIKYVNSNKQKSFYMSGEYKDCIIYVSDDLNDCLEYLKMIIESEKYNL